MARRPVMGRASVPVGSSDRVQLHVEVSRELKDALVAEAARRRLTVRQLATGLLRSGLRSLGAL